MRLLGRLNIVQYGHGWKQANVLKRATDAEHTDSIRRLVGNVATQESNSPVCRAEVTGQQVEDRGFAGSVGTDDGQNFPLAQLQTVIVYSLQALKGFGKILHRQNGGVFFCASLSHKGLLSRCEESLGSLEVVKAQRLRCPAKRDSAFIDNI